MEKDIVPGLLEVMQKNFNASISENKKLQDFIKLVSKGGGDYAELSEMSQLIGEDLTNVLLKNINAKILPNEKMYYNIAARILEPMMSKDYKVISLLCTDVQTNLNKNVNLGIKAITPPLNQDRIVGLINKIVTYEHFDKQKWLLKEPIINFSQSVVDDSVQCNAEFQAKSGIETTIERIAVGKCCEWCAKLEGKYRYPDVPKEVFARHRACRCLVTYKPGDGRAQKVHSKKWQDNDEYEKIKERINVGKSK